jgi:hypothetical protein
VRIEKEIVRRANMASYINLFFKCSRGIAGIPGIREMKVIFDYLRLITGSATAV